MPVDPTTDFLFEATGHTTGSASVVVTHPDGGGTTSGTTIIIVMRSAGATSMTAPSGWMKDVNSVAGGMFAFRLEAVAGGVTSWTFTRSASGNTAWYMLEVDHLATVEALEVTAFPNINSATATGATKSTTTTALCAGTNGFALAVFGSTKGTTGETHSWAGYTNSFVERFDVNPAGVAGQCIAVAAKTFSAPTTFETTATFTTSTGTPGTSAVMLAFRADDASLNAPVAFCTGFEFGTVGGISNSSPNNPVGSTIGLGGIGGTFNTDYRIIAGAARSGAYGLEIANTGTNANIILPTVTAGAVVFSASLKAVSGSGQVMAAFLQSSTASDVWIQYDFTTEKFGVSYTSGSVEWQTGTTPLGTHAYIQVRHRMNTNPRHVDWWIETGTGDGFQTSPADAAVAASASFTANLGPLNASTCTFHYDDVVYSTSYAAWPLGVHQVRLLVPETTGATVSGTAANFNEFTNNGTLAAFASTSGQRIDEAPPTISAASDGVVQVTLAASDYMNFPMTTLTLGADEIIAGVRALAALWGGTGTGTGTLGFRGHDGLTETTFVAASTSFDPDSLTTPSITYPLWYTSMWSGAANGAWTPTRLDAAALRLGFSTDATPDMGASALYLEVATRAVPEPVVAHRLTSDEDPEAYAAKVTERLHPYNSGVRIYTVSNDDATRTAEFRFYESGGSEHADSPVTVAPTDPPVDVTIGAESYGEIESTTFGWQ